MTRSLQLASLSLLAAALALGSCSARSLVPMDVTGSVEFTDVRLVITANAAATTTFAHVHLVTATAYRIGVYLPSDLSGTVDFDAEVDDGVCIRGKGSTKVTGVEGGHTSSVAQLVINPTRDCVPPSDGGTSGQAGAGGMTGAAGGSGIGGMTGAAAAGGVTGGAGTTGAAGTSSAAGSTGAGGVAGAGAAGKGGVGGGAHGGTTGTAGSSGTTGTAGATGTAGTTGRGGTTGAAGTGASGTTGTAGTGGSTGAGGTTFCICARGYVCGAAGTCVCAQSNAEACSAAAIECGSTTNSCGQTVTCSCSLGTRCVSGRCVLLCVTGAAGLATTEAVCPL